MEYSESLNLCWDNFETITRDYLKKLLGESEFCDVTLACDGKQVSAHKVILAGSSSFFQKILRENPHPHPVIYLAGVKLDYLSSVLDFVYTGEACIAHKDLESFLCLAEDLQIKGLIERNVYTKTDDKETESIQERSTEPSNGSSEFYEEYQNATFKFGSIKVEENDPSQRDITIDNNNEVLSVRKEQERNKSNKLGTPSAITPQNQQIGENGFVESVYDKDEIMIIEDMAAREVDGNILESKEIIPRWYEEGKEYEVTMSQDGNQGMNKKGSKICPVCGKSSRCNSELKIHMMRHTGERPFPCLFCPKRFLENSDLKKHTRIHTGEKPYQCSICYKMFAQSWSLKIHKKNCLIQHQN